MLTTEKYLNIFKTHLANKADKIISDVHWFPCQKILIENAEKILRDEYNRCFNDDLMKCDYFKPLIIRELSIRYDDLTQNVELILRDDQDALECFEGLEYSDKYGGYFYKEDGKNFLIGVPPFRTGYSHEESDILYTFDEFFNEYDILCELLEKLGCTIEHNENIDFLILKAVRDENVGLLKDYLKTYKDYAKDDSLYDECNDMIKIIERVLNEIS